MSRLMGCLVALSVAFSAWCAETVAPAKSEKAETDAAAKVDKTLAHENKGERIWIVPEYYGAMTKDSPYPNFPLVTKGNPAFPLSGILGEDGTMVMFDRRSEDFGIQHGFKLTAGGWITEDQKWGAELSGFYQPKVSASSTVAMDPDNLLCIPYFDAPFGVEDCYWYDPALFSSASIKITNKQEFWSVGAMGLRNLHRSKLIDIDLKFGVRHLNLNDEFGFAQTSVSPIGNFFNGSLIGAGTYEMVDSFEANNDFIGADLGARIAFRSGRFRAELLPRIALGGSMQEVEISGHSSALTTAGQVYNANSGFWALDTNIGKHDQTKFGVVPELNVKVGVEITKRIDFMAGYGITYWSNVVRAGDHVNRVINVDKVAVGVDPSGGGDPTTPAVPTFQFHTTDFWAHGITAGFKIKF
jgi:hypothetical protein